MEEINVEGLSPEVTAYIAHLEAQIEQLQEKLARLQKTMFGPSSEKRRYVLKDNPNQLSLFNEAELEADKHAPEPTQVSVKGYTRKPKRTKEELAEELPVEEILCELEEDEFKCQNCGSSLRPLGKETVREEIEFIPAQVKLIRYVRFSYVCENCEKEADEATIVKAPVPQPVIKKSLASPSSVAHVMYQKYVNGMPLYRQEKDWANQGVMLSRATLANWIIRSAQDWLLPLWEEMKSYLLKQPVIHADETVIQVLKEEGKKPSSESRMWVYCSGNTGSPPVILYEYQPTRSGEHARRFLAGFKGYLQTDGYNGYNKVPDVTRCGCWAHVRRKFEEAMPRDGDKSGSTATIGFDYCNRLFVIEEQLKDLSPEERKKKRQELSKPVLEAYWSWLKTINPLQGSKLGKAVDYSFHQRDALHTFLKDGRIEISNNRAENAIRPFVMGRKAWLFADTKKGAMASAIVYSIVETAKANNLNVYQYLTHIFRTMPAVDFRSDPSLLQDLLPWSSKLPEECRNNKTP